jgi:glycosyltransferase involved in cell wall biosynthesis
MNITVIIPTFNRAAFIAESIESILNQTHAPSQIIVSDDGSTDDTALVVQRFGPRITYLRKENGGKSSAINSVIPRITGDFVWIMDDDDIADAKAIENLLHPLLKDNEIAYSFGFATPSTIENGLVTSEERTRELPDFFSESLHLYRLTESNYFSLNSCLIRGRNFINTAPFDESLIRSQDYDFLIRLSQNARVKYIEKRIFWLREHNGIRGSASQPIPHELRNQAWNLYDRSVGVKIFELYPDKAFLHPQLSETEAEIQSRSISLRKAYIATTKGLLDVALQYLESAAQISKTLKFNLLSCEHESVNSIFNDKEFIGRILSDKSFMKRAFLTMRDMPLVRPSRISAKRLYWNALSSLQDRDLVRASRLMLDALRIYSKY